MSKLISLSQWWQRANTGIVAIGANDVVTFSQFEAKVSAWVAVLESVPGKRFAVFHNDAAEFLAITCALWQLACTACVPSDALPATVEKLKTHVDGFVGQFDMPQAIQREANGAMPSPVWQTIPAQHIAIEVYTSGTTGEPKAIQRTMQALDDELKALDTIKPEAHPDKVLSTVSHQHLYGMTFRLLRPFAYAIPFTTFISEYLEGVIAQVEDANTFSLVSSPAHLGRFNQHLDWASIKGQCIEVLSSAAPLKRSDSLLVEQFLDAPVKEIYGSSETGALAWRLQQSAETEALWQPLPHLTLKASAAGTLSVELRGNGDITELADQVSFNEGGLFSLHGRVDQVVKVEGKRMSLPALEYVLNQSPLVVETKALTLTSQRVEVAVAVVLSDQGVAQMQSVGRKLLIKQLKAELNDFFEPIVMPRRWRFVSQLPYNSQGKLSKQSLTNLFDDQACTLPEVVAINHTDEGVVLKCVIPPSLIYFDGHFDQQAILPGVVQVHWVAHYGKQQFQFSGRFKQMENLKFKQIILPADVVDLMLNYDAVSQKLSFHYESTRGHCSSGRICYA